MKPCHIMLPNGVMMPRIALGTAPLQTNDPEQEDAIIASPPSSPPPPPAKFQGFLPEKATRSVAVALDHVLKSSSLGSSDAPHCSQEEGPVLHLDTALYYRSQKVIGYVLNHYYMTGQLRDRSSVFIATKVFHPHNGFGTDTMCMPPNLNDMTPQQVYDVVKQHCHRCLEELDCGYVDLLILHWPGCWESSKQTNKKTPQQIKYENSQRRVAAWKVLEEMYNKGWARSIGVSNFSIDHLKELIPSYSTSTTTTVSSSESDSTTDSSYHRPTIAPMVNQFESSIYCQYDEIRKFCLQNNIVPAAYSVFGNGAKHVNINNEPILNELADKYSIQDNSSSGGGGDDTKTRHVSTSTTTIGVGQIVFSYLLQKGYGAVVFWSTNEQRIRHNLSSCSNLPTLSDDDMKRLDELNRSDGSWGLLPPNEIP